MKPFVIRCNNGYVKSRADQLPWNGLGLAVEVLQGSIFFVTCMVEEAGPDLSMQKFLEEEFEPVHGGYSGFFYGIVKQNETLVVSPGLALAICSAEQMAMVLTQPLHDLAHFKNIDPAMNMELYSKILEATTDAFDPKNPGYEHLDNVDEVLSWSRVPDVQHAGSSTSA